MRILITSGGTRVPVDPVRYLTNMSKGTFGSKIAMEALNQNHHVQYFVARDGVKPFEFTWNFYEKEGHQSKEFALNKIKGEEAFVEHCNWCNQHAHLYHETYFTTYDDYKEAIPLLVKYYLPDIVILTAAVSDYTVKASDSKIRSDEEMIIELEKAQKIISKIKPEFPNIFLVGFKLVVNQSEEQLIEACVQSIEKNGCDLVIGNDLRDIRQGKHSITIVRQVEKEIKIDKFTDNLAKNVVSLATQKGQLV